MTYYLSEPIDIGFAEVDELGDLAEIAHSTLTDEQKKYLAYIIIQQSNKFRSDLKAWNKTPANHKIWIDFQSDFRDPQKRMKEDMRYVSRRGTKSHGSCSIGLRRRSTGSRRTRRRYTARKQRKRKSRKYKSRNETSDILS